MWPPLGLAALFNISLKVWASFSYAMMNLVSKKRHQGHTTLWMDYNVFGDSLWK